MWLDLYLEDTSRELREASWQQLLGGALVDAVSDRLNHAFDGRRWLNQRFAREEALFIRFVCVTSDERAGIVVEEEPGEDDAPPACSMPIPFAWFTEPATGLLAMRIT